jgi:hypothetical protein
VVAHCQKNKMNSNAKHTKHIYCFVTDDRS